MRSGTDRWGVEMDWIDGLAAMGALLILVAIFLVAGWAGMLAALGALLILGSLALSKKGKRTPD